MQLVPLSTIKSHAIKSLLDEERMEWARDLHWDYAEPQRIIAGMIDLSALHGYVAFSGDTPAGYCFHLSQGSQGLIGNCFVADVFSRQGLEEALFLSCFDSLKRDKMITRVEAQLVDSRKWSINELLRQRGFQVYERCFLQRSCRPECMVRSPGGISLRAWEQEDIMEAAVLTAQTYQHVVDRHISGHYRSEHACLEFLKGVVSRPGCGTFLPNASFSLWSESGHGLVGYILTSAISPGCGHVPQIVVAPNHQGKALGAYLLCQAIKVLCQLGYSTVSLSVTSQNNSAMRLYDRFGFKALFKFDADVWERS
jgi:ribosomal protein S18 acetylase RimI-like enzyme